MDAYRSTRRQSGIDYPKPESGLAEWTSKIKAMQRQVDADEEAEQRRLEEEIAAARQARMRRNSRGPRSTDGVELARAAEKLNLSGTPNDSSSYDRPKDATERHGHQSEALRKIMGQNSVYIPEARGGKRPENASLASFIGGHATGPRLNKHAAQQDAHDPTQFNQPDTSTPHPIFGKGGIAMPGMVSKSSNLGRNAGRSATPSQDSRKAISDLKAVASALGGGTAANRSGSTLDSDASSKTGYLRQPDQERSSKSTSPTSRSAVGTEAAERYRPSASPTPTSTLKAQKSFDRSQDRSYGSEESERYRPSASPTPSALRGQKSFDRSQDRTYGTEDSERYRPSASPTPPSTLRAQKSFDRNNNRSHGTSDSDRYRSTASPKPALKAQKSFDRNSGLASGRDTAPKTRASHTPSFQSHYSASAERPASPQRTGGGYSSSNAAKSTPDLRTQKSWSRAGGERPVSSQKTGDRERATSVTQPAAPENPRGASTQSASPNVWAPTPSHTTSYLPASHAKPTPSSLSGRERTISTPSFLPKGPIAMQPTGKSTVIAPASLAKPIQPEPRTPAGVPKLMPSVVPSPAFQKAGPPKDVTPSISRLQGRGFVQNMVKTSHTLESHSAPPSTFSSPAEKPRPSPAKKGSVLDRWQPHMRQQQDQPTSPVSPPPLKTTFNTPTRKSTNVEPQVLAPRPAQHTANLAPSYLKPSRPSSTSPSEEPLTPRTTARMLNQMGGQGGPVGSATTMFVEKPVVDELGVKRPSSRGGNVQGRFAAAEKTSSSSSSSNRHNRTSELPAPTGKPLIHPTKGRARRPKKGTVSTGSQEREPTTAPVLTTETQELVAEPTSVAALDIPAPIEKASSSTSSSSDTKIGRLTEQWMTAGPILPKAASSNSSQARVVTDERREPKQYAGIRHALPGLAKEPSSSQVKPAPARSVTPKRSGSFEFRPTTPVKEHNVFVPPSPTRIPSTGSRATVMDVALALSEHAALAAAQASQANDNLAIVTAPEKVPVPVREPASPVRGPSAVPRQNAGLAPSGSGEKRKSSYDAFVTLPPLKEEATPAPSPANTFSRSDGRVVGLGVMQPIVENVHVVEDKAPIAKDDEVTEDGRDSDSLVKLVHDDQPLPMVDLSIMLNRSAEAPTSPIPHDARTISVEVISIVGSCGTTVTKDTGVFYESEVLAVIHRFKVASSGLVDTYVWGWLGRKSQFAEAEEKKLHELARRYGTMPVVVRQWAEPTHLVKLLGGRLAVRQGNRAYWAADNTAMHLVRTAGVDDLIFVDELDMNVKNLCSGFSYCVSALGTVYVWYGIGSLDIERKAALEYADRIRGEARVVEIWQGEEGDDDEMFWMLLGQEPFADADYWQWRRSAKCSVQPSIWRVGSQKKTHVIAGVEFLSDEANPCQSVYIFDCVWEMFVVVGSDARGRRQDIRLALDIASRYAKKVAPQRPYTPTVHVLVLPSQIPLELRFHVRDLDQMVLNLGCIPDHMNLISSVEATEQLDTSSWTREALENISMLPVGVDVSHVPRSA